MVQGFEKKGCQKRVAEALERGVLHVACPNGEPLAEGSESYKVYKNQYKRLCTHLRRNGGLARRLASGELAPERAAAMADDALMCEEQRSELAQFRQESLHEALAVTAEDSAHWTPSENYTCPRCECSRCVYIQTFKGSHGYDDNNQELVMTIRCTDCKYLWKEDEVEGGRNAAGTFVLVEPTAAAPQAASAGSSADAGPSAEQPPRSRAEAPTIWGEAEGRRPPTWLLPASK